MTEKPVHSELDGLRSTMEKEPSASSFFQYNLKNYDCHKYIKVRLLSKKPLNVDLKSGKVKTKLEDKEQRQPSSCFSFTSGSPKKPAGDASIHHHEAIVLHFHGGGFVAMSSNIHQNYTRRFANELNVPVFSVDYRLSPEHPFPAAVDDCWQVYYWICT